MDNSIFDGDVSITLADLYGDEIRFEFVGPTDKCLGVEIQSRSNRYFDLSEDTTRKLYEFLKARLGE